jgi:hypothetical protein
MVHPVGFAGYGFPATEGCLGEGAGLAAIRIDLAEDRPFGVREPQSGVGKGHGQSIMKGVAEGVVHLYCGRGDSAQHF